MLKPNRDFFYVRRPIFTGLTVNGKIFDEFRVFLAKMHEINDRIKILFYAKFNF